MRLAGHFEVVRVLLLLMFFGVIRNNGVDINIMFRRWQRGGTDYGGCVGNLNYFYDGTTSSSADPDGLLEHGLNPRNCNLNDRGIFLLNCPISFGDVKDGTSTTLMVGEIQRVYEPPTSKKVSQDGWAVGGCGTHFDTENLGANRKGMNNNYFEEPGSDHPGGAQFCMADGAVTFISETISETCFEALGTMAGGETASMEAF